MAKTQEPHVFVRNVSRGYEFLCMNCGASYIPAIPCPLNIFNASMKAFNETHKHCRPREEVSDRDG